MQGGRQFIHMGKKRLLVERPTKSVEKFEICLAKRINMMDVSYRFHKGSRKKSNFS